jgi:hypothetical protein
MIALRSSMRCPRERATGQEIEHLGLLVNQFKQHGRDLVAKLLRGAKTGRAAQLNVGEVQPAVELRHRSVRAKRGVRLHTESAQKGILLENYRDACREIG